MKFVSRIISHGINLAVDGVLLMVTLGLVHRSDRSVPALGYWVCFLIAFVVAGMVSTGTQWLEYRNVKA